jgi:hypothetical protein
MITEYYHNKGRRLIEPRVTSSCSAKLQFIILTDVDRLGLMGNNDDSSTSRTHGRVRVPEEPGPVLPRIPSYF